MMGTAEGISEGETGKQCRRLPERPVLSWEGKEGINMHEVVF